MVRIATLVAVFILAWIGPLTAQQQVVVRTQAANERVYFQIRMASPPDMRVPRVQGQALDKIAFYDLASYPRLVPLDAAVRNIAWHYSTDEKTLEFLGLGPLGQSGKFRLTYPTESSDKPPKMDWKEVEIVVDLSTAAKVSLTPDKRAKAAAEDDLEGRWAEAWAREFAIREREALDSEVFRSARQALCRKYHVTDPMPRPPLTAAVEVPAKRTIDIKEIPNLEPMEHPWRELLAGRQTTIEPLARLVPADFYYLRLKGSEGVGLLNQVRHWAKIALTLHDGAGHDGRLAERYVQELGLARDEQGEFRLPRG